MISTEHLVYFEFRAGNAVRVNPSTTKTGGKEREAKKGREDARVLTREVLSVLHVIKWNALVEVA